MYKKLFQIIVCVRVGMLSAAASLGLIHLWDVDGGLTPIDKYLYTTEDYIKVLIIFLSNEYFAIYFGDFKYRNLSIIISVIFLEYCIVEKFFYYLMRISFKVFLFRHICVYLFIYF